MMMKVDWCKMIVLALTTTTTTTGILGTWWFFEQKLVSNFALLTLSILSDMSFGGNVHFWVFASVISRIS